MGVDLLAKYRGFSLYSEYVRATSTIPDGIFQRVRTDGSTSTSFTVNGVQDIAAYIRGRLIVGAGFNVQGGYFFRNGYSVDGRYSLMMPEANSFLRNTTFNNRSRFYTLCVSRYMGRHYGTKVQLSTTYIKAEPGSTTVTGATITGKEFSTLLMFSFAL